MFDSFLILSSIGLGLLALLLPIFMIIKPKTAGSVGMTVSIAVSALACAGSLCLQILYTNHLVRIEDWAALMDTSHALAVVCTILFAITTILNAAVLISYCRKGISHGKIYFK